MTVLMLGLNILRAKKSRKIGRAMGNALPNRWPSATAAAAARARGDQRRVPGEELGARHEGHEEPGREADGAKDLPKRGVRFVRLLSPFKLSH